MFSTNRCSIFQRFLIQYSQRTKTPSISISSSLLSSLKLGSIMKKLIDSKQYRQALDLFDQQSEIASDITLNLALKACTKLNDYQRGINIQRQLSSKSLQNPFIQTSLIHFYMQCHDMDNANRLYSTINKKSNSIYSAMFKGLISNKMPEKVLDLLDDMVVEPNEITLVSIFSACAQLANNRAIRIGKKFLQQIPKDCQNNNIVLTSAINMLMKFGDVDYAEDLLVKISQKNIITYSAMMTGYVNNKMFEKALDLFEKIPFNLNEPTFTIVFNACAHLSNNRAKEIGKNLLKQMPKDCQNNNIVLTSAVNMLMKFGDVDHAEDLLRKISQKNIITYGAMMTGYVNNKMFEKALDLFEQIPFSLDEPTFTIVFNACAHLSNNRAQEIGKNLLEQMPADGRKSNNIINSAIYMLMKFGDVKSAEDIFRQMIKKNIVTYGTMMRGYIENNMFEKVLDLLEEMPFDPDESTFTIVFNACAHLSNDRAKEIGKNLLKQMPKDCQNNNIVLTSAINMLMKFGDVDHAEDLLVKISQKNIITYGAMMTGYVNNKMFEKALDLFEQIPFNLDEPTFTIVFNACAHLSNDRAKEIGKNLLKQMPKDCQNNNIVLTSAINMLMKFGDVDHAEDLLGKISQKDIITYSAMMTGYVNNKMFEKALDLFEQIPFNLNEPTFTIVFNACAHLSNDRAKEIGKNLLKQMPKDCQNNNIVLASAVNMLMKFGDVDHAEDLLRKISQKNIITYGAMMTGYVNNKMFEKALDLFEEMPLDPGEHVLTIIFKACAHLSNNRAKEIGKNLLKQMPKDCWNNSFILTSAIYMLMKFGDVKNAEDVFGLIKKKELATYGAMLSGYNLNDEPQKCFELFQEMKQQGIIPGEIVFIVLISACAQTGIRSRCQSIVDQIPLHLQSNRQLQNAIINMWGRAGFVEKAREIFQLINTPDVIAYTSMINAFALNGMGFEAIELYRQMPEYLRDEVTHICVLNGCSHSGLLNEARSIFNEISIKTLKITTAMIDCLSRLFVFDDAQKLMNDYEKSNPPSLIMYMAIMSGLRNQRQSALSKQLYSRMKYLFPDQKEALKAGSILLSNIYSSLGDYQQAEDIRLTRIKELGKKVKPGLTWTEVNGELVRFKAHDTSHPRSSEIYAKLERLLPKMIEQGYRPDASWITRPIRENETVQSILCGHSEKLAIGLNLIQEPIPSIIQVTKNLRICGDCHQATKLIAKIEECEIIVRDANRVHHFFPNGQCSCQDHF